MPAYKVRVLDADGRLIVGATLSCVDDTTAKARFVTLPLPQGDAELTRGPRVVARRPSQQAGRLASGG